MDAKTRALIQDDEVSLKEVVRLLLRRKRLVGLVILACGAVAALVAWFTPNSYRATIIVAVATNSPGSGQMGGLGSMVSQVSGLASLAGLALGGGDSKRAESVAVLQSEVLIEDYIRDNHLLQTLYADEWDAKAQRWTVTNPLKVPTVWKATQRFKRTIANVTTESKTGLVTLTITWYDAKLAAKWANDLVARTNDRLRSKAIVESERNIAYLNGEAAKTDVVGVKTAIYSILQSEISKAMLARGSDEYALKVVDPAFAPELKYSPYRTLWTAIGLFAGMLICLTSAFVSVAWSKAR